MDANFKKHFIASVKSLTVTQDSQVVIMRITKLWFVYGYMYSYGYMMNCHENVTLQNIRTLSKQF